MKHQYSVYLSWSKEDSAFIAQVIELPGAVADGATREEALANLDLVIDEWIETATELKREIPQPVDHRNFEEGADAFKEQLQQHVRREVETAVQRVLQDLARSQGPLLISGQVLVGTNDPGDWWKRAEDQSFKRS